MFSIYIV